MLSKSKFAVMIPIRNMNRALRFYRGKLGGKLNMRGQGDMKDSWASVTVGKTEFWLVRPERHEARKLAYNVFLIRGIGNVVAEMKRKGVKFVPGEKAGPDTKVEGPITYMPWGAASAFFRDTEGNLLMLWEQRGLS
jgi:catechol 2,3-dioxygenase-like lactoylglutathione lyase family enzyme